MTSENVGSTPFPFVPGCIKMRRLVDLYGVREEYQKLCADLCRGMYLVS